MATTKQERHAAQFLQARLEWWATELDLTDPLAAHDLRDILAGVWLSSDIDAEPQRVMGCRGIDEHYSPRDHLPRGVVAEIDRLYGIACQGCEANLPPTLAEMLDPARPLRRMLADLAQEPQSKHWDWDDDDADFMGVTELLRERVATKMLGAERQAMLRACKNGEIRHMHKPGRKGGGPRVKVHIADAQAWLAQRGDSTEETAQRIARAGKRRTPEK
jgi:hypothetical protein